MAHHYMRHLTEDERTLVEHLIHLAALPLDAATLTARPMDDGGMGSLRFGTSEAVRFGASIAEVTFEDEDGVPVSAALYVDENGALFELDLWKVDFSPLRRWPTAAMLGSLAT